MKRIMILILTPLLAVLAMQAWANPSLKNKEGKLSYAIGVETGKAFKAHGVAINPAAFSAGLADATRGQRLQLSQNEIRSVLVSFRKQSLAKLEHKMHQTAEINMKAGEKFLSTNRKKHDVIVTSTGLQYKIIKPGKGRSPTKRDRVTVNYEGKLVNGKVFDSSYKRGKPATFPVAGVIPGWQEALTMMKPGAVWMLYIPPKLAYGERGAPGAIGPNETLIFKVNLISVKR